MAGPGKRHASLSAEGDALLQELIDAESRPGELLQYLQSHAAATEGSAPGTVDVLLVPGEPVFWLHVGPTSVELRGRWPRLTYSSTLAVSPATLLELQRHAW